MGCSYSRAFVVNEFLPGQDGLAVDLFEKLHLSGRDIDRFYTAFTDMDSDNSHLIRRDEFCAYFNLEKSPITVKMVKMMQSEHDGCLNFSEMVGLLWDFLSRDPHALGSFAFHLFDKNKNGFLCSEEITEMVECLHHTSASKHKGIKKITADMCGDKREINVATFHEYCRKHDEVCLLLLGLQNTLREQILGKSFWEDITRKRSEDSEQLAADYIQSMYANMRATKAQRILDLKVEQEFENARNYISHKKSGGGGGGGRQEQQRTNYLYNYFRMKDVPKVAPSARIPKHKRITRQSSSFGAEPELVHKKHTLSAFHQDKKQGKKRPGRVSKVKAAQIAAAENTTNVYAFDDDTDVDFDASPTTTATSSSTSSSHSGDKEGRNHSGKLMQKLKRTFSREHKEKPPSAKRHHHTNVTVHHDRYQSKKRSRAKVKKGGEGSFKIVDF